MRLSPRAKRGDLSLVRLRSPRALRALGVTTLLTLTFAGCKKETPPVAYQALPVERRDIVVSAQASGAIQPDTTVEVQGVG